MNRPNSASNSYLDIIFDGRNKKYGGYELRKNYPKRIGKAMLTIVVSACLLSVIMIGTSFRKQPVVPDITKIPTDLSNLHPENPLMPPVLPKHQTKPAATPHTTRFEIEKDNKKSQPPAPEPDAPVATTTTAGTGGNTVASTGLENGTSVATNPTPPVTPPVHKVYDIADVSPEPGYDLQAYFLAHIHYPDQAKEVNVQGRVAIRFVVDENGNISELQLIHGIGSGCDEEALRVISAMPPWKPGKQHGIPVKVYFTQAVTFKLE
jgi:protein TonB